MTEKPKMQFRYILGSVLLVLCILAMAVFGWRMVAEAMDPSYRIGSTMRKVVIEDTETGEWYMSDADENPRVHELLEEFKTLLESGTLARYADKDLCRDPGKHYRMVLLNLDALEDPEKTLDNAYVVILTDHVLMANGAANFYPGTPDGENAPLRILEAIFEACKAKPADPEGWTDVWDELRRSMPLLDARWHLTGN